MSGKTTDPTPCQLADQLIATAEVCEQTIAELKAAIQDVARARGLAPQKRKRLLWLAEQIFPLERDHIFFAVAALRNINGGWN